MKRLLLYLAILATLAGTMSGQSTVSGSQPVQGASADNAAAEGNPVGVAGVDGTGKRQELAVDSTGKLSTICSGAGCPAVTTGADGVLNTALSSATGSTLNPLATAGFVFNSATFDRMVSIAATTNSAGTGILATGAVAEMDDAATAACTENQFCPLRLAGASRALLVGAQSPAGSAVALAGALGADAQANLAANAYMGAHNFNGSTWDRIRSVIPTADSVGTGIAASGMMAQLDETSPQTVTEDRFGNLHIDSRRYLYTRNDAFAPFNCLVAVSTATTIQAVGGSCIAPGAGLSLYITDIEFGSSAASGTAADSFPTLKSGTGGTCGSATAVIWQALSAANSTVVANLSQPIKVTANNEVCWIMSTAGSKTIQLHGYIAP